MGKSAGVAELSCRRYGRNARNAQQGGSGFGIEYRSSLRECAESGLELVGRPYSAIFGVLGCCGPLTHAPDWRSAAAYCRASIGRQTARCMLTLTRFRSTMSHLRLRLLPVTVGSRALFCKGQLNLSNEQELANGLMQFHPRGASLPCGRHGRPDGWNPRSIHHT